MAPDSNPVKIKRVRKIPSPKPQNCQDMSSDQFLKFLLGVDAREWKLDGIKAGVEGEVKVSHITLSFAAKPYKCPECGSDRVFHDKKERTWRHANLDDTVCYIHAKVPRCKCPGCGCIEQVDTPWADERVSYTKRFTEVAIEHMSQMSLSATSRLMMTTWRILDGIVESVVKNHLDNMDLSGVRRIRIDETSAKKNHRYITVVTDADTNDVIFITKGKDSETIREFTEWLSEHNGTPDQIELVATDFGPSFLQGVRNWLPNAESVLDQFHLIQIANRALDKVRASEQYNGQRLKSVRFALLKAKERITGEDAEAIMDFSKDHQMTAKAYELKEMLRSSLDYESEQVDLAHEHLKKFVECADSSGLKGFVALAKTVSKNIEGILRSISSGINNGYQEGLNGRIQLSKRLARGYHKEMRLARIAYFRDIYRTC